MLTELRLDNWKSFGIKDEAATLPFGALTLLVGPNASGKSNVLDALRFLQGMAFDYPIADVLRGRYEGQRLVWPPVRGGPAEAARVGDDDLVVLTTSWAFPLPQINPMHSISFRTRPEVMVEFEELVDSAGQMLLAVDPHPEKIYGELSPGGAIVKVRGTSATIELNGSRWFTGQVEQRPGLDSGVLEHITTFRHALREMVFLDIRPDLMRDYRPENGGHLGTSGENVSPVLHGLSQEARTDVTEWLSELLAPEVEAIEFDVTKLREVMLILVQKGVRTSARSASDGTLRFLGLVVALLTATPGSLVILEEPDVGLHPSRIRLLVELLEYVTSERKIQVIATTHSPTLLAHLSPETLADVLAFGRDLTSGITVCKRAGDLDHFAKLRDATNIEHLVSSGWLERAL